MQRVVCIFDIGSNKLLQLQSLLRCQGVQQGLSSSAQHDIGISEYNEPNAVKMYLIDAGVCVCV